MVKPKINTQADLCWTRKKRGRGFSYFDGTGQRISNPSVLKRLRSMAIPPMWEKVKICSSPNGKVQAVGRDGKGRKQYIYHPKWTARQQRRKFLRLRNFGKKLPDIRSYALEQLKLKGWPREKILSLMILVLDETGVRIGNRQYLNANETYGLSTLRRRHLDQEDDVLIFHFKGKSNQEREVRIEDHLLTSFIKETAEQPGYEIFRYRDGGSWHTVDSDDINAFIKQHLGKAYSSKYFRTWVANRLLLESHEEAMRLKKELPRRSKEQLLVRLVADQLGNTPAVCKGHYLHPEILKKAVENEKFDLPKEREGLTPGHSPSELVLLKLMK